MWLFHIHARRFRQGKAASRGPDEPFQVLIRSGAFRSQRLDLVMFVFQSSECFSR
jgi:hypothetical protein